MIIGQLWQYIRLGHSGYLAFGLQCSNFVLIAYTFLIERFLDFSPVYFAIMFVAAYVPAAAFMGYIQVTRQHKVETKALFENNPRQAAVFLLIIKMLQEQATAEEVAEKIRYLEGIAKKQRG